MVDDRCWSLAHAQDGWVFEVLRLDGWSWCWVRSDGICFRRRRLVDIGIFVGSLFQIGYLCDFER